MNKNYLISAIIGLFLLLGVGFFLVPSNNPQEITVTPFIEQLTTESTVSESSVPSTVLVEEDEVIKDTDSEDTLTIPGTVLISDAPYINQAPFGNWDFPYKEACEEASILGLHAFVKGDAILSQEEMKKGIDDLTAWGDEQFNGRYDTNIADTSLYLTDYLGYDTNDVLVAYDITIDDIKAALSQGYPVAIPAAGRELGNRYFQTPGPIYHMLVIVGYDNDEFITNDPGTRRGEGYRYKQQVLFDAIHDWTGSGETILEGKKGMIVLKP